MALCGFVWLCVALCGFLWLCVALCGFVWLCVDLFSFMRLMRFCVVCMWSYVVSLWLGVV